MLRTVLAGLRTRPLRLLLSAVAIALGVAFVAGSLVLSEAITAGLRDAVAYQTRGVDASVMRGERGPELDERLLAAIRRSPGVAAAEARTTATTPLKDAQGKAKEAAATELGADERLRPFDLVDGRLPDKPGEAAAAESAGLALGQRITLLDQEGRPQEFTVVGTVHRPTDSGIGSAELVLPPAALRALAPGGFGEIVARANPGVGQQALVAELEKVVGKGITVATGKAAAAKLLSGTVSYSSGLTGLFSAFAVLAVVVAAMVIANSFTILIAQRTRELALLRCVGADRRQVFTGVLAEAAVIGAVASVAGLFAGLGVAAAAQALLGTTGVYLPLSARTVLVSLGTGVLVTVLAAALPARAATRVAPVAALRTQVEGRPRQAGRGRSLVAITLAAAGIGLGAVALAVDVPEGAGFAVAAMVALLGAALAAGPLLAGPVVRVLGTLTRPLLGQPAELAALNADRNPRRTAASAAALTIGLAVVTLVTTVAAGVESGAAKGISQQLSIGFRVTSVIRTKPLPTDLADRLAAVPGVTATTARIPFSGSLGAQGSWGLTAVRGEALATLLRPVVLSGRLDSLKPGELAISRQLAEQTRLAVGDTVKAGSRQHPVPLKVIAIYDSVDAPGVDLGMALVELSQRASIALSPQSFDDSVLVQATSDVRPALEQALAATPLAQLHGIEEIEAELAAPLRRTLDLLWALTALAVLIAFAGIANTLTLSVLERTRESALLRALGLTRSGLGLSLAAESVFVALLGAACGLLLGLGSAWLITRVAGTEAAPVLFELPWGRLAVLLGAALLAAPLAAVIPARRAARVSPTAGMAP